MVTKRVYLCEDSIEGIFTAVYKAWASGYGHKNNLLQMDGGYNMELFCEYIKVVPEEELALKVTKSIKQKIGVAAYEVVYCTAMSDEPDKADLIYRFMILGFHMGPKVMNYLSNDVVGTVLRLKHRVSMEKHHYLGFIRFEELQNTILCSKIRPKSNILALVAPHFSNRLMNENWMIIDEGREIAVIHPAKKPWFFMSTTMIDRSALEELSENEERMRQAFLTFIEHLSIKERENKKLQQNMCPLRYREFMPEFERCE